MICPHPDCGRDHAAEEQAGLVPLTGDDLANCTLLVVAIVKNLRAELEYGKPAERDAARAWLDTQVFHDLMIAAGQDPDQAREALIRVYEAPGKANPWRRQGRRKDIPADTGADSITAQGDAA